MSILGDRMLRDMQFRRFSGSTQPLQIPLRHYGPEAFLELVSSSQLGIRLEKAPQFMMVEITQPLLGFKHQPVERGSASTPLERRRRLVSPGMYGVPDAGLSSLIPLAHQFTIQLARIVASFFPSLSQIGEVGGQSGGTPQPRSIGRRMICC